MHVITYNTVIVKNVAVASKDDNWAGKYVFDLRSLTTQQRLNDPRHNLADCYYIRIRALITYKLADLFTQYCKLYNYYTMQDRYRTLIHVWRMK
jgi:hypothetical protein